ncbi:MAG: hypothetical protein JOZ68_06595 [Acidimicrobiia bacterium]|nr:hypothetical protein [Acidimicrobiia bacterium]MBV9283673.1 hypothetical protein [Acidimicrobiia bacterium]
MGLLLNILIAAVAAFVLWRLGIFVLRSIAHPPEPPEEGELRRVNLRYRCSICGAEVKMVQASEELPEPPRHCMEDMDLVAPPNE